MSKRMIVTVTTCMALLIAGAAKAGYRAPQLGVRISKFSDGGTGGSGTFSDARANANARAEIRCGTTQASGYCIATSDGTSANYAACTTVDLNIMNVIRSANPDAYVSFGSDGAGNCVSVLVVNGSGYAPKPN